MYRANLGRKDKGGAIIAVILIHAALLFAFLNIAGKLDLIDAQSAMRVFDLDAVQPPPPPPEPNAVIWLRPPPPPEPPN